VHLVTREAVALYLRHLRDKKGVPAFHISNRAIDLKPVLFALSQHFGLASAVVGIPGKSEWILLAQNPEMLKGPQVSRAMTKLWTDDFSNLSQVLR
jgi:hypothetical protein